jgi:hypothetical protein
LKANKVNLFVSSVNVVNGDVFLIILFNNSVKYWNYIASVTDEWMSVEHWRNASSRSKLNQREISPKFPCGMISDGNWASAVRDQCRCRLVCGLPLCT